MNQTSDQHENEARFEQFLGNMLRAGVVLAASVVSIGGFLYLLGGAAGEPDRHVFHGEPAELRSFSGVIEQALQWNSRGIIQLGLLLLIATPVARVVFSAIGFFRQRDFTYVALTVLVFLVLIFSLLRGES
jgi:uncharacterized membrane protein